MRGNKRKRDNWFITNGNTVDLPNTEEDEGVQDHAKLIGEGSDDSFTTQLSSVSNDVPEGVNRWLGFDPNHLPQLDGSGKGVTSELANRPKPVGCHGGQPITVHDVGLGPLGHHSLGPDKTDNAGGSLANEAVTWLGARGTLAVRSERANSSVLAETEGSGPLNVGPVIEESDLTPEDFWSLLRDASYEVW